LYFGFFQWGDTSGHRLFLLSIIMNERIIDLKRKASNGDVYAQTYLGYIYESGKGVSKRMNESAQWYHMAAKSGNHFAIEALNNIKRKREQPCKII